MLRKITGAAVALSLGGCVSPYVAKPYDRASAGVEQIAMVDDSAPAEPIAYEVASAGSNFGLIGALVDAGIQESRQNAVNNALKGAGFDAEDRLEARVISALNAQGYQVAVMPGAERQKRVFMETYSGAPAEADAYLDLVLIQYGYLSAGMGQPFRPSVIANVRLVSVADGRTLMENQIVYNSMYPQEGVITLTPNPEYAFKNRDEMLADPARLAAGIEDALNTVADTASQLLR